MEITEVRIKLMFERTTSNERLQAFCSVTFENMFVVRDIKIILGTKGPFIAMPSRKLMDRCPACGSKNHLQAWYCNHCGLKLNGDRAIRDIDGWAKLHADIAHPVNATCREYLESEVLMAFRKEIEKAKQPGYVCTYGDFQPNGTL